MMENQEQIIQEEMRKLITKSCDFENFGNTFYSFHKSLLKFFFGAIDVSIDYDEQIILLWNSKPKDDSPIKLYDMNEAVSEKVNYTNLEETLKGCIEKGGSETRFYRTLLQYYNQVDRELEPTGTVMSA